MQQINIMALRHSAFYSPLLMSMAGGFLKQVGLKANYRVQTPDDTVVDNIRRGDCHLAQSAVATGFATLEQGQIADIVHFAQINERDGFFLAARQADSQFSWSALKGRRVLVDHFFQPMAMLKYGLHQQGIAFDDFEVIDAGDVVAMDQAFRQGLGDFVHQQGPAPQQMEHDGVAHVVAAVGDAVGPVAFSSLCAGRDWLQTDMARAFMQAYRASLQYVIDAPERDIAAQLQGAGFFTDVHTPVLQQTLAAYKALGCWRADPAITESSYQTLLDVFQHSGLITRRHAMASLVVPPPA